MHGRSHYFDKELGDGGKRSDSVAKSAPRTPAPITPGTVAPSTPMPTRSSSSSTPLPLQPAPATPNNHDPLPDISAEPLPAQPPAEHEQDQPRDDEEPYEIEEFKPRQLTSNKPLYDFKKVFQRLPQLAKENQTQQPDFFLDYMKNTGMLHHQICATS